MHFLAEHEPVRRLEVIGFERVDAVVLVWVRPDRLDDRQRFDRLLRDLLWRQCERRLQLDQIIRIPGVDIDLLAPKVAILLRRLLKRSLDTEALHLGLDLL